MRVCIGLGCIPKVMLNRLSALHRVSSVLGLDGIYRQLLVHGLNSQIVSSCGRFLKIGLNS